MKTISRGLPGVFATLLSAGALLAHHALTNYDTTKAVRVKGTIVQYHAINPHSIIYIEEKTADGPIRRWAVEGPSVLQLNRLGFAQDLLKPGASVEVCGYLPKETIMWQVAGDESTTSLAGRLLNGETMVMPDGKQLSWGDYGVHKCFAPGYADQHGSR
jgi:hypothetical protein